MAVKMETAAKNDNKVKVRVVAFITSILVPMLVGVFSAFLTAEDMKIYETMEQPPLSPPGWLFPIVWTILYAVMGVASYIVCASDADVNQKRRAMGVYVAQLLMNMFWSTLFFTYERYLLSLIWLLVMWVQILICTVRFFRIQRAAGYMMAGVLAWTTFAAYLNIAIYAMSITPAV